MLALEEKARVVALLRPDLLLKGKGKDDEQPKNEEIIAKFEDKYLEVRAKKQVYLTAEDAESFFQSLPDAQRTAVVEAYTKGLCQVLLLEHLDGDIVQRVPALKEELASAYGEEAVYLSESAWEAARDLEFFFPHLDAMPAERTLAVIKPDGLKAAMGGQTLEQVVEDELAAAGLFVVGKRLLRSTELNEKDMEVLCQDVKGTPDYKGALGVLMSEPGVVTMCVEGPGAIGKLNLLCGPTSASRAKERACSTLRAKWGTDSTSNAIHASGSLVAAEQELKTLFPEGTLQMQRTLCIVKPHALEELLSIRMEIEAAGFTVLKEKHTVLTEERAKEFFRECKAKPTYNATVKECCAGQCCIMVLCRLEAVTVWEQLMGPEVVKDAVAFRPRSIRARYGREGQKNAVHGSADAKSAAREVHYFFPELGTDPTPGDDEVRDFLFRKSAGESMDLKTLSSSESNSTSAGGSDYAVDPTLQQLISSGLLSMCQVRPKGLDAVTWFQDWLLRNNPNAPAGAGQPKFAPAERTKRFVEYGINQDGLPFSVEAPEPQKDKKVEKVVAAEDTEEMSTKGLFNTKPHVIFVVGSPGEALSTHCARLAEEFNFVHLNVMKLMDEEEAAKSPLGAEITKHRSKKEQVPEQVLLQLLKKSMLIGLPTNRFLLDCFPHSLAAAKTFEQEISAMSFVLYLEGQTEATKAQGEALNIVEYYDPIGKVRRVDADSAGGTEAVYAQMRPFFTCRFLYLLGPPGAPIAKVGEQLSKKYGASAIDLTALLNQYASSEEEHAAKVKQHLAKGKPIDASIACPLILAEIQRDMKRGVQNFIVCDFPQNLKQSEFLEYQIPCVTKPLLLDFTRPDAEDLAGTISSNGDAEAQVAAFFGEKMQKETLKAMQKNLVKIPCSLKEADSLDKGAGPSTSAGLEQQLVDCIWTKVCEKVKPGLTIVLGLPGSGSDVLASLLAKMTPNTYAVDCDLLLDREMERKTEVGLQMLSMLANGQTVPLSFTLDLLKGVAALTCSDSLVIQSCPTHVDQVAHLAEEFRIEKVFYINGDDKAVASWKEAYVSSSKGEEPEKTFVERKQRLVQIVEHFRRLGRITQFDVTETPKQAALETMMEQATLPRFVVVTGRSLELARKVSTEVASQLGLGTPVRLDLSQEPAEAIRKLKQEADSAGKSMFVLDNLKNKDFAQAFFDFFGAPQLVVNVECDDEFLLEEIKTELPDAEEEEQEAKKGERSSYLESVEVFREGKVSSVLNINIASLQPSEDDPDKIIRDMCEMVRAKMLPKAYVLVMPTTETDFGGLVTNSICANARSQKFTVIDTQELFLRGRHSAKFEEQLHKASFTAEAPDCLPAKLWVDLFQEAFTSSANPTGPFLITNFPTASALSGMGPTFRDQFCMLSGIVAIEGILHLQLSEQALAACSPQGALGFQAQQAFDDELNAHIRMQYGDKGATRRICEAKVDAVPEAGAAGAAEKVSQEFLKFLNQE